MDRFLYPHVTGPTGERLKCQFRGKWIDEDGNILYKFLMETSGDTYTITKSNIGWVFVFGNSHLTHWIDELGGYVDESGI